MRQPHYFVSNLMKSINYLKTYTSMLVRSDHSVSQNTLVTRSSVATNSCDSGIVIFLVLRFFSIDIRKPVNKSIAAIQHEDRY